VDNFGVRFIWVFVIFYRAIYLNKIAPQNGDLMLCSHHFSHSSPRHVCRRCNLWLWQYVCSSTLFCMRKLHSHCSKETWLLRHDICATMFEVPLFRKHCQCDLYFVVSMSNCSHLGKLVIVSLQLSFAILLLLSLSTYIYITAFSLKRLIF